MLIVTICMQCWILEAVCVMTVLCHDGGVFKCCVMTAVYSSGVS